MSVQAVLLPVFFQVALVFALLALMGIRRAGAVRAGAVRAADVSLGQRAWPDQAQQASNAYANQFELPFLFFALVPLAMLTRKADLVFVVLSWVFVLSRYVHAGVYVTRNVVPFRFGAFAVGVAVLLVLWLQFAIRIFAATLPA